MTGRTRKKALKTAHTGQKSQTLFPLFCCSSGVATSSFPGLHMQAELCRALIAKGGGESTARPVTPGGRSHQTCFGEESRDLILGPFGCFRSSVSCCPALPEHSKANVFPFNLLLVVAEISIHKRGAGEAFPHPDVSWATGAQTDRDDPAPGCSGAGTWHRALPACHLCLLTPCSCPVSPIALLHFAPGSFGCTVLMFAQVTSS